MTATLGLDDLERFRASVARRLGLQFDDSKLSTLAEVFRRRLEAAKVSADSYLARLEAEVSAEEVNVLAQELTVAETYFFRHAEQYQAFTDLALPERLRSAQAAGRNVQILSAGCASGEEPYSLAIAVQEIARAAGVNVSILGLDVNPAILQKAKTGRFSPWAFRETPPDVQKRWFRPDGRDFLLDDLVVASVQFERCNFAEANAGFWPPEAYDIVFCRNVLMYFKPDIAQALVGRITRALRPGGYLFLGHAETLRGLSSDFHLRHTHETFYYQRRDCVGPLALTPGVAPVSGIAPAAPADVVNGAGAWIEAIQSASQRIEALASKQPGSSQAGPAKRRGQPAWDLGLALELLRKERFVEALELVQALPPESRRNPEVLLLQAVLLTHNSQFAKAEEVCRHLLEVDELNAGAHYLLALCREGVGDRIGSTSHDRVAVYLDPAFAMPRLHLGLLARRGGDREAGRRDLGQALELLQREDMSRLLLFGGGFGRDALVALCRAELLACGAQP